MKTVGKNIAFIYSGIYELNDIKTFSLIGYLKKIPSLTPKALKFTLKHKCIQMYFVS